MAHTTIGHLLLQQALPPGQVISGALTKKTLGAMMTDLAHKDPHLYVQTIHKLKTLGDEVTTDEGVTVGLDDIEPDYIARDRIMEPALTAIRKTRGNTARIKIIQDTESKLSDLTKKHPGQLTAMASSGSRGSFGQLMRVVTSPTAAVDEKGQVIPWMISKSFAEGLKAPDSWVAMVEARKNAIEAETNTAVPGEVNKLLINTMGDQAITMPDCGTTNGVSRLTTDADIHDRYLAKAHGHIPAGTLVTGQIANELRKHPHDYIVVRSPMTCIAPHGVCQKCFGLNARGSLHTLGTNVGVIAAQAMGEPLTQATISARHATRTSVGQKAVLTGLAGFKQLTEIPQSFFNKATLADHNGTVTDIKKAPQGGHYIYIAQTEHYVPPQLALLVKKGAKVEAGDALSDGIPKPDEVLKHKGLGVGRQYLVDQLHGIFQRQGIDMDKRHFEILAKTDLNYVRMMDKDSATLGVMRGEVVDYNKFRDEIAKHTKTVGLREALGDTLGNDVLHYTVGTRVTPTVMEDLKKRGIKEVPVAPRVPLFEPVMKSISRTPLLRPDWLAKLGHRNLKNTILEGAAFGETSDIHSTHPIPAFVYGKEFGHNAGGNY